jgi:TonB-linked SusC/RagA family outer membrane protein
MKKLLWSFALPGLALAQPALAQQTRTVTGTVTAAADRTPLPGVNVVVKGGSTGAQTGSDGRFTLQVPEGATLVFSFIGYASQERAVGANSTFDVALEADAKSLNEVVVTAFGIKQERRELNYAVQQVTAKEIIDSRQTNIVNALQGKVAGVQINSSGGAPGEGASIVIRGGNSLDGDNQPLFVIDGIIMDNSSFTESTAPGGGSQFNGLLGRSAASTNRAADINPEDIATISVLKGPAAAALYGLRAANGAVVITTKKGTAGRTSINYRTQFSVDEVNRLPKLQNQFQQGQDGVFDNTTRMSWGPRFTPDQTVYDNLGTFFQKGKSWQNYLTMQGGSDKASFYVSAAHQRSTGVVPESKYDKSSVRISGTMQLSPKFAATGSANYINSGSTVPIQGPGLQTTSGGSSGGFLTSLLNWPRNDDATVYLNPDGSRRRLLAAFNGSGSDADADNPYWSAKFNPQTSRTNRIIGNAQLSYDPVKWATISYNLGNDFYTQRDRSVRAVGTSQRDNQNGAVSETTTSVRLLTSNFLATLRHSIGENLSGSLVLGNTVEQNKAEALDVLGTTFLTPDFVSINNTATRNALQRYSTRRLVGNFGRLNVTVLNQVNLELQGRYDMSSTLPRPDKNKNFGKGFGYGSAAAGWEFTRAFGLDQNPVLNYGKIRASVAEVGKDTGPYRVDSPLATATYIGGGYRNGFFGSNRLLKPERTRSTEFGVDLQFFQNRLGVDATYYVSRTRDQLIAPRVSQASNFILQYINGGTVENKGIEVALTGTPVKTASGFTWDVLANFFHNRSRTVELPSVLTVVYQSDAFVIDYAEGGAFPGRSLQSIGASTWQRTPDGKLIINPNTGYPIPNANFSYAGDRAPKFTTQITNTLSYKGLSLNFMWDFRKGGMVVNGNDWFATRNGTAARTADRGALVVFDGVLADLTATGAIKTNADGSVVATEAVNTRQVEKSQNYYRNILGVVGEAFIEDGSWARLRYATLTYNVPAAWLQGSFVKGVELGVTGRNLLLFTNYSGVDPETAAAGAGVRGGGSGGFDYGSVPATRGVDMSVRVNF